MLFRQRISLNWLDEFWRDIGNIGIAFLEEKGQIPKSKVKRLRYEAGLKYPLTEADLKNQFKDSLHYARIIPKSERCIEINIESESVRQYVDSLLKKEHRFSDGSFSSEILRITADDYVYLITEVYGKNTVKENNDKLLAIKAIERLGLPMGKHIKRYHRENCEKTA